MLPLFPSRVSRCAVASTLRGTAELSTAARRHATTAPSIVASCHARPLHNATCVGSAGQVVRDADGQPPPPRILTDTYNEETTKAVAGGAGHHLGPVGHLRLVWSTKEEEKLFCR